MVTLSRPRLTANILIGAAVLCLAGGTANASGSTAVASPLNAEMQRLQSTWGSSIVRTAQVIPGSHVLLVGTRDQSLLRSASPRAWLGARYPVVVTFVERPGVVRTPMDNKCDASQGVPMMSDSRG